MKTKSGYETNGDYIKFKCGFTGNLKVETEKEIKSFKTENEADMHIITNVVGCHIMWASCNHFKKQEHGCYGCSYGKNKNVI